MRVLSLHLCFCLMVRISGRVPSLAPFQNSRLLHGTAHLFPLGRLVSILNITQPTQNFTSPFPPQTAPLPVCQPLSSLSAICQLFSSPTAITLVQINFTSHLAIASQVVPCFHPYSL